jgi:hypothetical protein
LAVCCWGRRWRGIIMVVGMVVAGGAEMTAGDMAGMMVGTGEGTMGTWEGTVAACLAVGMAAGLAAMAVGLAVMEVAAGFEPVHAA